MLIRKHEHAFLEISLGGNTLLIDPGMYCAKLPKLENVVGIVFTHVHDDHSYLPHIKELTAAFPDAQLFGPADVVAKLAGFNCQSVYHGDHVEVAGFQLDFFGDLHQEIHWSIPLVQNVGVLVNSKLYYPGDSYTPSEYPFEILACPSSAPWMKISDLIDFIELVKPKRAFPTHNALLSDHGHALQNGRIKEFVEKHGGSFEYLKPSETTEV
jgi:L-ascorbate metabolism protein UlaG (beta-lactamase superfamily)